MVCTDTIFGQKSVSVQNSHYYPIGISRRSLATVMSVQEIGVDSTSTIHNVDILWLSTKQLVECTRCFTSAVHNNRLRKGCSIILTQQASD